jgi:hypothetical protein
MILQLNPHEKNSTNFTQILFDNIQIYQHFLIESIGGSILMIGEVFDGVARNPSPNNFLPTCFFREKIDEHYWSKMIDNKKNEVSEDFYEKEEASQ